MQSLYPESSIPTPPFSPATQPVALPNESTNPSPLEAAIDLVDSLVSFYQQERLWVYRTRARLEDEASNCLSPREDFLDAPEQQPDGQENNDIPKPKTRWTKRKRDFKMRLEGLPSKPARRGSFSSQPVSHGEIPSRAEILLMYGRMMETRMESCQRVSKLVRNANRANLHNR